MPEYMPKYHYGIDLGGTKIELVACDASLQVRHRQRVPTPTQDYDALVHALISLVRGADAALDNTQAPVGIGVPGIVDAETRKHLCANIPCLTGRELLPVLRKYALSDRSRYYWGEPAVTQALQRLNDNLAGRDLPLPLISQYLPEQVEAVLDGSLPARAAELARHKVGLVLARYMRACHANAAEALC